MALKFNTHRCVPFCTQRGPVGPWGRNTLFEEMLVDFFLSPWHQKSVPYNEQTYRRILIGGRSSVKTGVFPLNISWKKRLHENVDLPRRNAISATTGEVSIS